MAGEVVSSQPAWIVSDPKHELPEPVFEAFDMTPFTDNGEFAPTDTQQEHFTKEGWARWRAAPEDSDIPHILTIDFTGVKVAEPHVVFSTLGVLLRISRARSIRQFYCRLENLGAENSLEPWRGVNEGLDIAELVVVARRSGQQKFDLIGEGDKRLMYRDGFQALAEERQWIDGGLFSRVRLGQRNTALLNVMYTDGVIIKHPRYSGPAYYRSLV